MVAERRVGKTTVVKKMLLEAPDEMHIEYRDVEGIGSPLEFAEAVAKDVDPLLPKTARGANRLKNLFHDLAGTEVGGVIKFPSRLAEHWKSLLEATLEDLFSRSDKKLYVFVWDELPLMIDKIVRSEDAATAMDVLDTLRGLRQKHTNLRMIFTGSIGLHHVLSRLQASAHLNDVTNDMDSIEVDALTAEHGAQLACALLKGEALKYDDSEVPAAIATAADRVPFYIHHVVRRLLDSRASIIDAKLVEDIVAQALVDPQDPWHFEHFHSRLNVRYGAEDAAVARPVLTILADRNTPASLSEISESLRSRTPMTGQTPQHLATVVAGDDEPLRKVLKLLERDHYIRRNTSGHYHFRFALLRRWWKLQYS